MKTLSMILAVTLIAGCASTGGPAAEPEELDLAGRYTFTTTVQGMAVNGQMRVTGEPGAYDGSMYSDVTGEVPFSSVRLEGEDTAVLVAETPDGPVDIRLTFDGDTFTGSWALGSQGGSIRGRRVEG